MVVGTVSLVQKGQTSGCSGIVVYDGRETKPNQTKPDIVFGSDLFYFRRIDFLVVVDYFSKYLIMRKIHTSTSSAVIK